MSATTEDVSRTAQEQWLKRYYFARAAFSIAWVAAAFTIGQHFPVAAALLVVYPAWDALANVIDASRSGGLGANPTQAVNVAVSVVTAIAVGIALASNMNWVLGVFGVWASLSGLLQLGTAIRRWKAYGAQWAMILSGGQSAVVGVTFVKQALGPEVPSIDDIAPYAALGAIYFLISAVWLTVKDLRRRRA